MDNNEFNALCDAHGFSAVARDEFPTVPRNLLKALVDAAVLAERERSAWQPIETAPRDGTEILAWDGENWKVCCLLGDSWWSHGDDGSDFFVYPTHWQPLSSPPPITP